MFCEPCTVISGLWGGGGGGWSGEKQTEARGGGGGGNRQLGIYVVSGVCLGCGAVQRTLSLYFCLGVLFFVFVFIFSSGIRP